MNYFEPEIGENDVTSNKHMNGYFLEQEALRVWEFPSFLCVLVFPFLKHYPFSTFKYPHSVEILKLLNLDCCLVFLTLLLPVTSQKAACVEATDLVPRHLGPPLGAVR